MGVRRSERARVGARAGVAVKGVGEYDLAAGDSARVVLIATGEFERDFWSSTETRCPNGAARNGDATMAALSGCGGNGDGCTASSSSRLTEGAWGWRGLAAGAMLDAREDL